MYALLAELHRHIQNRDTHQNQIDQALKRFQAIKGSKRGPHGTDTHFYDRTTLSNYYAAQQELLVLMLARDQSNMGVIRVALELADVQKEHGSSAISIATSFQRRDASPGEFDGVPKLI